MLWYVWTWTLIVKDLLDKDIKYVRFYGFECFEVALFSQCSPRFIPEKTLSLSI